MPKGAWPLIKTHKAPGHRQQKWWVPPFPVPTLDFPDFRRDLEEATNGSMQTRGGLHSVTLPRPSEPPLSGLQPGGCPSPFCVMLLGRQKSQLMPESQNLLRAHSRITHCVLPCQLLQAVAIQRIPGPPLFPGPGPAPQPRRSVAGGPGYRSCLCEPPRRRASISCAAPCFHTGGRERRRFLRGMCCTLDSL